jgi:hypothetical protein
MQRNERPKTRWKPDGLLLEEEEEEEESLKFLYSK